MQNNTTVAEMWGHFEKSVISQSAPDTQRSEMKLAFYSGAMALLDTLMKGLSPGNDTNEEDVGMVDSIHEELRQFAMAEVLKRAKGRPS